jgi:hypothetical protein
LLDCISFLEYRHHYYIKKAVLKMQLAGFLRKIKRASMELFLLVQSA